MPEHSPEPWSDTPSPQWTGQHDICDGNGSLIGTLDSEDARRAVACVNKCSGLTNEQLADKNTKFVTYKYTGKMPPMKYDLEEDDHDHDH